MIQKRVICPQRLRRVPKQFSWIDQRLVRNKHICGLSCESQGLYLFLVTVSDSQGLSFYSDKVISDYLGLDTMQLIKARSQLHEAGLIAYSNPLYQVLCLDRILNSSPTIANEYYPPDKTERGGDELVSVSDVFKQLYGGKDG